jgi:hypothetical protein
MHSHRHHEHAEYERQDLSAAGVFGFLVALFVFGVIVQFAVVGTLHLFEKYNSRHQPPQNPLVERRTETRSVLPSDIQKFPQPRLEESERQELHDFRLQEVEILNSYSIDAASGTMHIPIEQAMRLVVQRGLPTKPQAGTAPPSVVNTVNQAAQKADTSRKK